MLKIVIISLICSIIIIYLKNINSELYQLALIGSSLILIFFSLSYIVETSEILNKIITLSKVDASFYKIIFKITAISYLVEFGAGIIEDFGLKSLADKLIFIGKLMILIISMPIIYSVFNVLTELLK